MGGKGLFKLTDYNTSLVKLRTEAERRKMKARTEKEAMEEC